MAENTIPTEQKKEPEKGERIIPKVIEEEMKEAYVNYAMSVIVGRALPDVRDGLKPVHRRILYAMQDMGMFHNKPTKKRSEEHTSELQSLAYLLFPLLL